MSTPAGNWSVSSTSDDSRIAEAPPSASAVTAPVNIYRAEMRRLTAYGVRRSAHGLSKPVVADQVDVGRAALGVLSVA